ncbi:MAG: glycosyltransferase [Microlunatus sp.]|nr:glycosyltransferase [Microlunatus sp.]
MEQQPFPRVLIAHDYVTQRGGAERVVLSLLKAFPGSELITSVYNPATTFPEFEHYRVRTLWMDRVPWFRQDPRRALPFLGRAFAAARTPDVDVVVCSTSGFAHGLRTSAAKVVYCHTPPRWLHVGDDYLAEVPAFAKPLLQAVKPMLRRRDDEAAASATTYVANSSIVKRRILDAYGIQAQTLFPPVLIDTEADRTPVSSINPGYFLVVSRQRGYKQVASICEAVEALPGERLVVVGGLPARESGDWCDRIQGVSGITDAQLRWLYANAAGLIALSREDFGLTPIEAYSYGTPAILLRSGGYLDSSVEGRTCLFVDQTGLEPVMEAITRFRQTVFDEEAIKVHASAFNETAFHASIRSIVMESSLRHRGASAALRAFDPQFSSP